MVSEVNVSGNVDLLKLLGISKGENGTKSSGKSKDVFSNILSLLGNNSKSDGSNQESLTSSQQINMLKNILNLDGKDSQSEGSNESMDNIIALLLEHLKLLTASGVGTASNNKDNADAKSAVSEINVSQNQGNLASSQQMNMLKNILSELTKFENTKTSNSENLSALSSDSADNNNLNLTKQQILSEIDQQIKNILSQQNNSAVPADKQNKINQILNEIKNFLTADTKVTSNLDKNVSNLDANAFMGNNSAALEAKSDYSNKLTSDMLSKTDTLNNNTSTSDKKLSSTTDSLTQNKDDKFLNQIIDNKTSGDNYSKVINMMNQFSVNNSKASGENQNSQSLTINKNNFTSDIIKSFNYMEDNNVKDMTVKIMPKELGEVFIRITSDNNVMRATITASSKDAYNLLNANLHEINNQLNSQHIKIQNVNINIYNSDTTYFSGNGNFNSNQSNGNSQSGNENSSTWINNLNNDSIEQQNSDAEDNNINNNVNVLV